MAERKDLKARYAEVANSSQEQEFMWVYSQDQADAVMDAQEARLKELGERILERNKTVCEQEQRIKELEASQPKWISVKDRLPNGNPMLPALCEDNFVIWWGCWHDCDFELHGIKAWTALPKPPKGDFANA